MGVLKKVKDYIEKRAIELAEYIINTNSTVRMAAKQFNISKSTVHKDITSRLSGLNKSLYKRVKKVLEKNKDERHIRGGMATKEKYLRIHKEKGE